MFLQDVTSTGGGGGPSISDALNAVKNSFDKLQDSIFDFEDQVSRVNRQVLGQGSIYAKSMREQFAKATMDVLQIGGNLDDVANTFLAINKVMGKNTMLSAQELSNMVALQKSAGITADEMGSLIEAFDSIGVGVEGAVSSIDDMASKARSLGLNVNTFLSTTAKNLKLVNSYGFKDGVDGLTRMVARAQALRIDMSSVKGLAADLLNPEKAVELAAEFQNLGGAIGALGDPFQLMNLGQNDMEGLQNAIINATKASVQFNGQTKRFEISALEMRRLRAFASATGADYEQLADSAVRAAKETMAFEDIKFLDVDSDKKQLIANLAKLNKDGKLEIQLPNMDKAVELTELNAKQIEDAYGELQKQQETGELDALGVARAQLSTLEQIVVTLKTPAGKLAANIAGGQNYEKVSQNAKNLSQQVQQGLETLLTEENYESISNLLSQKISNTLEQIDFSSFETLGASVSDLAQEQLINVFQRIRTTLLTQGPLTTNAVPSMVPQTTSSPVNNMTPTTNATASINVENVEVIHKGTVEIKGLQETLNIASLSQSQLQELGTKIKSAMGSQFLATG
jgi:hypothetical protein